MSIYTITPTGYQTEIDENGAPIAGALIYTYAAGTLTPIATYSNSTGTANANPIVADSAGRWTAYLSPGTSYKFLHCLPVTPVPNPTSPPSAYATADYIMGTAAGVVIVPALLGTTVTAGQGVYLSDGSGSKTQGRWYPWDSTNAYSSTTPEVAIALAAGVSGDTIQVQQDGRVSGLSGFTAGTRYYASTSGTFTSTAPSNARYVGQADTATSLIADCALGSPGTAVLNGICQGRITAATGTPVTVNDVTAATSIFFAPYGGNRVALYDGANWSVFAFTQLTVAVPATTIQMYDVFLYNNSGTLTLELLAWTNDTTRATALTTQDGVYVKTGALTRRYLGSFRTTGSSGQTEDSFAKRYVWNYYNRMERAMRVIDTTDTWNYSTTAYRQANANAANQLDFVIGVAEVKAEAEVCAMASSSDASDSIQVAIGYDSTSAFPTGCLNGTTAAQIVNQLNNVNSSIRMYPAVGRHILVWLERAGGAGTTTWTGDGGAPTVRQSGIHGSIQG